MTIDKSAYRYILHNIVERKLNDDRIISSFDNDFSTGFDQSQTVCKGLC